MPELPRGCGARKVCASPIPRLALPNSNSTDSSRGTGGGHWQKRPELPASGLLWTPSILCGLPLESLPPLRVRAPLHSPSPCLGLAPLLKFKGFKCKYFSFIDASCLQRAGFLAAQLYCPISFPYLGTGEPRGLGGRGQRGEGPKGEREQRLPWWFRSWKLPPRVLGLGRAEKPGSSGGGDGMPPKVGDTLQILGCSRRGKSWGGGLEAEVFFSFKKNKSHRPGAHWLPFSPFRVSPPTPPAF